MPIEIQALDEVPEGSLKKIIKSFAQDGANIVTAINDSKGTFSVEATFIDPGPQGSITKSGKMSTFGGPHDTGVSPSEGLALYDASEIGTAAAGLFLDTQPPGTTGLARRLNPDSNYLAVRWDYSVTPPDFLRQNLVTVSANDKSVVAHPVDWGPNITTGRVADLSSGLARALGLDTDDDCKLEIPLPAAVAIPIPASGPAHGVDLAAIDATKFPADMTRVLVAMTTSNDTTYWVVNLIGPNEGGQTLMRQVANNPPELLRSDTIILPIKADAQVPATVAAELNKAIQKEPDVHAGPAGSPPGAGDDINAKVFATAKAFVGHVTSNVPGTQHGNLACAWAVNEVTRLALGKPISSEGGKNGLSTDGIFDVLKAHHTKLGSAGDAKPGTIIIAPTEGENHGHVGIVGTTESTVGNTQVFSNKSIPGIFAQNFTIGSFTSHYTGKGLQVLFFALNPDQFTAPGA
jgi:hypothetical protein